MRLLELLLTVLCACAVSAYAQEAADDRFEDSVVRLAVSKHVYDTAVPWQAGEVSQQLHLGAVLANQRILTTANAVADASFIEMTHFGEPERWEMRPIFVDWETNLALLAAVRSEAFADLKPVTLGDDLKINEKVDIFRARDTDQMSRMSASLQEVGIYNAVTSQYSLATYLLKVQQTGLGWSEPVFHGGRLVALTTAQDSNFVYALPMSVIKHFLEDKHDETAYRGFPAMGVELDPLVSPDLRKLLGASGAQRGVRIADVMADSPFGGLLQTDDVLLEVAATPVNEYGLVTHPKWGKLHLKSLVQTKYAGDVLELKILRQGVEHTFSAPLTRYDSNRVPIRAYDYGQKEPHLIFGGLVFQELSRNYLKQWGREWRANAPFDLLYLLEYKNAPGRQAGQRVVLLSRVLADDFNRGYADLRHLIVDQVNGRPVASLAELAKALAEVAEIRSGKRYAKISLIRGGGEVVLAYEGLQAAHERLARTYEITSKSSFFAESPR